MCGLSQCCCRALLVGKHLAADRSVPPQQCPAASLEPWQHLEKGAPHCGWQPPASVTSPLFDAPPQQCRMRDVLVGMPTARLALPSNASPGRPTHPKANVCIAASAANYQRAGADVAGWCDGRTARRVRCSCAGSTACTPLPCLRIPGTTAAVPSPLTPCHPHLGACCFPTLHLKPSPAQQCALPGWPTHPPASVSMTAMQGFDRSQGDAAKWVHGPDCVHAGSAALICFLAAAQQCCTSPGRKIRVYVPSPLSSEHAHPLLPPPSTQAASSSREG
jgi:hypothetical protein